MDKFIQLFSSYKTSIVLLLVYAAILAAATFIEKFVGTVAAKMLVYYSPLFIFLQLLLVLNFIIILIENRFLHKRRGSLLTIHTAFIVILSGALTTHLFGKEGTVHIREGETSSRMVMHTSKGTVYETLPFSLELTDFRLVYYPGSQSPSSYESDLRLHLGDESREAQIYMNKVLDVKGYRFFQASYDKDEKGTVLSVNYDRAGRTITYTGYFLLLCGFILLFTDRNSRLRRLSRQLKELRLSGKLLPAILLVSSCALPVVARNASGNRLFDVVNDNAIPSEHAAKFGRLPVQWQGRIVPMNTFSSEILRKLYKAERIGTLDSDQFLLSVLALPQMWMQIPFIVYSNNDMAREYGLSEDAFSYGEAFDDEGRYKFAAALQEAFATPPAQRDKYDKDLIKADEKVNTLYQLFHHTLPAVFPPHAGTQHQWYSPGGDLSAFSGEDSLFVSTVFDEYLSEVRLSVKSGNWQKADAHLASIADYQQKKDIVSQIRPEKIQAEVRYNRLHIFQTCKKGYLILGGLLLLLSLTSFFYRWKYFTLMEKSLFLGMVAVFAYHVYGMALRWYISGYAPWSNSYETMVYVSWATVLAGLILGRKNSIILSLAVLFAGMILFVSGLQWMDPQITPLVPVLKSPWLMFHVAVIASAYGFFGFGFLLGTATISWMAFGKKEASVERRIRELTLMNQLSLLTGLALMTIGIFLGAVWANESWGRYWGWDPKETWALIVMVAYAVVTHLHLVKRWNNAWLFNLCSVFAFTTVLMTFLGVNYLLSGMHSYGHTEGAPRIFGYILLFYGFVSVLGVVSFRKRRASF